MPSVGPQSPSAAQSNSDIGDADWTDPGNVFADDGAYATAALHGSEGPFSTYYLDTSGYDFAGIPVGATIDGLELSVVGKSNSGSSPVNAQFRKGADWFFCDADFSGGGFGTSDGTRTAGGASDLCGTSWTRADVTAGTFAARFNALVAGLSADTVSIDHVRVTVYYTGGGGGGGSVTAFLPALTGPGLGF